MNGGPGSSVDAFRKRIRNSHLSEAFPHTTKIRPKEVAVRSSGRAVRDFPSSNNEGSVTRKGSSDGNFYVFHRWEFAATHFLLAMRSRENVE